MRTWVAAVGRLAVALVDLPGELEVAAPVEIVDDDLHAEGVVARADERRVVASRRPRWPGSPGDPSRPPAAVGVEKPPLREVGADAVVLLAPQEHLADRPAGRAQRPSARSATTSVPSSSIRYRVPWGKVVTRTQVAARDARRMWPEHSGRPRSGPRKPAGPARRRTGTVRPAPPRPIRVAGATPAQPRLEGRWRSRPRAACARLRTSALPAGRGGRIGSSAARPDPGRHRRGHERRPARAGAPAARRLVRHDPHRAGPGAARRGSLSHRAHPSRGRGQALSTLRRYAALVRRHRALVRAVATSAIREAKNGPDVVERVRRETGLELEVVSGKEEARLICLGVLRGKPAHARNLLVDIGGGSTEVAMAVGERPSSLHSVAIGSVRLAETFDCLGRVPPDAARADADLRLRGLPEVAASLRPPAPRARAAPGPSGASSPSPPKGGERRVTLKRLRKAVRSLADMRLERAAAASSTPAGRRLWSPAPSSSRR